MNLSFPSTFFLSPTTRNRSRARGFSLLEVAIALVIFVFGALAIVRIFPGALRVINIGGSRQNALNINRATMARVQNNPPYAVYDMDTSGNWTDGFLDPTTNTYQARAVVGSTKRAYSLPRASNQSDFFNSALFSVRGVVGEPATVLLNANNGYAPFILTRFPIVDTTSITVNEKASLSGVVVSDGGSGLGQLDFSNARWSTSGDAFAEATGDIYYVTLRYQNGGQIWGVADYPVTNTNTNLSLPVPFTPPYRPPYTGNAVVAGQVDVVCLRQLGVVGSNSTENDGRGFVNISPSAGVNGLISSNGMSHPPGAGANNEVDQVFIDYQADWSRVLQEGTATTAPDRISGAPGTPAALTSPSVGGQMSLAAPYVDDLPNSLLTVSYQPVPSISASPFHPASVSCQGFKGIWGGNSTSAQNFTLADAAPAATATPSPTLLAPVYDNPNDLSQLITSDLKNSRVTFTFATQQDQTYNNRVSYLTRDQWAQQLSVAAAAYKPYVSGQIEPWRDYYLDANNGIIYFHASEAGKSVMVTYSYQSGSGASATTITMRNRLLSIEDDPVQAPSALTTSGFASQLQLTDIDGNPLSGNLLSISSVRGASVTVRTAWLDGSRYTQSFLTAMRAGTGAEAMP